MRVKAVGWTHATPLPALLRWGKSKAAVVKAGEPRAKLVIQFVALQGGIAGALLSFTTEGDFCLASFCQSAAYLSCLCYPSVGLSTDKNSTIAKQDYNASCTQCTSAKFMVRCNLRWSYSNLDPLELTFPYAVRFPEDKALLTWESFTGYMDKAKLV